ncbi:MAG TPA: hypothetical protein VL856_18930 [Acidimicrobiia bacterium]|jgi:hypothetical protein|nr:hypothetical protein [Acidimicrobiia bacterium]
MWRKRGFLAAIDELRLIEAWYGTDDTEELIARYDAAIEVLSEGNVDEWLDVARDAEIGDDSADAFRENWLGRAHLPEVPDGKIEASFRDGLIEAHAAAREAGLKTSFVVAMLDNAPDAFAVDHIVGVNAVTIVISISAGLPGNEESPE